MTAGRVGQRPLVLRGEHGLEAWREQTRALLRANIAPDGVDWVDATNPQTSLASLRVPADSPSAPTVQDDRLLSIPREFFALAQRVLCHKDPGKWSLLYRIAFRITRGGERQLLRNVVDDDVIKANLFGKAVKRDAHKMKAFVRFRRVEDDRGEHYVAFYRSEHRVLPLVGPFFARRFSVLKWTVLTPMGSASWDGNELSFGPASERTDAPAGDELEEFWKTYYASVFNPARVNPRAMTKEMPKKYWSTLPEASIIEQLLANAPDRTQAMKGRVIGAPLGGAENFIPSTLSGDKSRALTVLTNACQECCGCDLYKDATHGVFGEGPADASVMIVGEQPGDQEDVAGRPFVGPAGQLLDRALNAAGINRSLCYVTNAVKHFKWTPSPTGKRRIHSKPNASEVRACKPWLDREISLVQPKVIVLLGATAAQSLLGASFRVTKSRGRVIQDTPLAAAVVATVHPSSILRAPDEEAREKQYGEFVVDLQIVSRLLKSDGR